MTRHPFACAGPSALALCCAAVLAALSSPAQADPHHTTGPLPDTHAPAGVMFEHMHKAGQFMLGYRYAYTRASGDTLHGTSKASDHEIMDRGCSPHMCSMKASEMVMQMHMLDIMYAPTDWMTLMVMPMWMSHDMTMKPLNVAAHGGHGEEHGGGAHAGHGGGHTAAHSHGVEGWGDTIFGPELRLAHGGGHHLQFSPMVSAPTGSVDAKMGGAFTHYGMQIGSGTWDFLPSLTYTGRADRFAWGAQVLGIVRLEEENSSGYRLGDVLQVTGWGSYRLADWISVSVRGLYTEQGKIEGHYDGAHQHSSPPDLQFNYGGRFWDLGFGVNTVVRDGALRGLRLGAEWLQPIEDDANGYQVERDGTLWISANMGF
jgi:hypothetical protein